MKTKKLTAVVAAVALSGGLFAAAESAEATSTGLTWEPGSGIAFDETPLMTAEFGLSFDSKYMTYGLVDNRDPIMTPSASATFFDFLTFEVEAIFDLTKQGKKASYAANRGGKYMELDPSVYGSWSFSPDDHSWLPTAVDVSLGYSYEYHPRSMPKTVDGEPTGWSDTQYVWAELALPDLWIEPLFYFERDLTRDDGTYVNLELGHAFPLIDNDEEDGDPVLAFRPSVAQGFGNTQRVRVYLWDKRDEPIDRGGLMDTCLKGELTWTICDCVSLSGYVAYYDYLFDSRIREGARGYTGRKSDDRSYHFVGGLALTVAF
jgi:hypothetical protein